MLCAKLNSDLSSSFFGLSYTSLYFFVQEIWPAISCTKNKDGMCSFKLLVDALVFMQRE